MRQLNRRGVIIDSLALVGACAFGSRSARAAEPLVRPPVAAYSNLPTLSGLSLSPNGERLVTLVNRGGNTTLVVSRWDGTEMRSVLESDNTKFKFNWVRWVNDSRLVVSMRFSTIARGAPTMETRALAMDLDGQHTVNLVPPPRDRNKDQFAQFQDQVIDWMPGDGEHVLMSIVEDFNIYAPAVFKVEVNTGRRTQVLAPRYGVWDWITDRQHRVRVGVRRDKADVEVIACDPDGSNWRTLWKYQLFAEDEVSPLAFGADAQALYVEAYQDRKRRLFLARLDRTDAKGRPELKPATREGENAVGAIRLSRRTGELIAVGAPELGDAQRMFCTETLRELARSIDESLPQRFNRIVAFDNAENRYLLASSGNGVPTQIFIGDRKESSLLLLADLHPDLPLATMVGKRQFSFKARDGLTVKGFLTQPRGEAPAAGWPLLLLPHGGPISSDDLDFDTWTEFLASRGYAVLQVNFRGSASEDKDFRDAGLKRWGLEMQDDLTDAVNWAIAQKLADPRRIAAVGGSYGGYAALMGSIKTPDLYRCVISLAGVTDLLELSRGESIYLNSSAVTDRVYGNYSRDRDQLLATSPSRRAAEIKVPVLLLHGTDDHSVPYAQAETMAKALEAAGKNFRLVTLNNADHSLSRQVHRLQFFTELEAFLAKHL